jgi:L-iditol 2-dehydrogenase
MSMRCIRVETVGAFHFTTGPLPSVGPEDVLVKTEVTGLCRTDLKLIRQGHRDLVLPRIPGEEVVGVIVRRGASVSGPELGERVYVYPGVSCQSCTACLRGAENLCREMRIMGFHRDGGFAEYVATPARSVIAVPEGLEPEHAVFAEPLSCCLNALSLGNVQRNDKVGIWGAGPAGTLLHRAATAFGAVAAAIEPDARRRQLIRGLARPPEGGLDLAVVAVGDRLAYEEALRCLGPRGRLVLFSGLSKVDAQLSIDVNQLHYSEQSLVGAYGCSKHHGEQALRMIHSRQVIVDDLISHDLPLEQLERALTFVEQRVGMKILLRP